MFVVGLLAPVIGIMVQLLTQNTQGFSRSGCVMVACSLTIIYLNHFFAQRIELEARLTNLIQELPPGWFEENKHRMSRSQDALKKIDMDELILRKSVLKKESEELKHMSASMFVGAEFAVGVIGTLIWGFGDIPAARLLFVVVMALLYIHVFNMYLAQKKN